MPLLLAHVCSCNHSLWALKSVFSLLSSPLPFSLNNLKRNCFLPLVPGLHSFPSDSSDENMNG